MLVRRGAGNRALAAGANEELVGLMDEHRRVKQGIGVYFTLHTAFIILLDARVIRGPMAESLVSAASIGYYILYLFVRSVGLAALSCRHMPKEFSLPPLCKSHVIPSLVFGYGPALPPWLRWLGHARVAPDGGDSDKRPLTTADLPLVSLGSSLRNLMKVVQVRAPPPPAARGVQHQSATA
jgi:hypothetical protein